MLPQFFFFFSFQDITKASVNCISAVAKTLFHATAIHESPIMCIYWVKALLTMVENIVFLEKTRFRCLLLAYVMSGWSHRALGSVYFAI